MIRVITCRVATYATRMRHHPDRGAQTVDVMLWVAVFLAIVAVVGGIFRDDIRDFLNSLQYSIGF